MMAIGVAVLCRKFREAGEGYRRNVANGLDCGDNRREYAIESVKVLNVYVYTL